MSWPKISGVPIAVRNKWTKKPLLKYDPLCAKMEQDIEDERLVEVIDKVKADAIKIFESKIIKNYCLEYNITIRMYCHKSAFHHAANKMNSYKIY